MKVGKLHIVNTPHPPPLESRLSYTGGHDNLNTEIAYFDEKIVTECNVHYHSFGHGELAEKMLFFIANPVPLSPCPSEH